MPTFTLPDPYTICFYLYHTTIPAANLAGSGAFYFGNPADRETLNGVLTEQYYFNGATTDVPLFSFNKNIDGVSMGFEVTPCTFVDKTYVYESAPEPANKFSFI
jgi:hypothetical protein